MSDALAAWAPAHLVFLCRCTIVGGVSIAAIALVGWIIGATTDIWQALYGGPALVLAYTIGFKDSARWRAAPENRWQQRSEALRHYGSDGKVRIQLAGTIDMHTKFDWDAVTFIRDGLRVRIACVREVRVTTAQILTARTCLTP
jgi:hypothetical protein